MLRTSYAHGLLWVMIVEPGWTERTAAWVADEVGFAHNLRPDRVRRVAHPLEGREIGARDYVQLVVRGLVEAMGAGPRTDELALGVAQVFCREHDLPFDMSAVEQSDDDERPSGRAGQLTLWEAVSPTAVRPRALFAQADTNQAGEERRIVEDYISDLVSNTRLEWLDIVGHPLHEDHSGCDITWEADLVAVFVVPGSQGVGAQVQRLRGIGALILPIVRQHVGPLSYLYANPKVGATLPPLVYDAPPELPRLLGERLHQLRQRLVLTANRRASKRRVWQGPADALGRALSLRGGDAEWPDSLPLTREQATVAAVHPLALASLTAEQLRALEVLLGIQLHPDSTIAPTPLASLLPDPARSTFDSYCAAEPVPQPIRAQMLERAARLGLGLVTGEAAQHLMLVSTADWANLHEEILRGR